MTVMESVSIRDAAPVKDVHVSLVEKSHFTQKVKLSAQ